MVQIPKKPDELDALAQSHYKTLIDKPFAIAERIEAILKDKKIPNHENELFGLFKKNLKDIIISRPEKLSSLIQTLDYTYKKYIEKRCSGLKGKHRKSAVQKANDKIFSVFCYSEFTNKKEAQYAYDLARDLNVEVCVYCNRQYTHTLHTSTGRTRPTFDHFFDKASYPYFALSFYNLIPSCYVCNSSLKNQKPFTLENNIHPFIEGVLNVLCFHIDVKNTDFIAGTVDNFNLSVIRSVNCMNDNLYRRARNNFDVFKIDELYQFHKDYAGEIILKAYYYTETKINELYNYETDLGIRLFSSKEEVIEFVLGNYISEHKLGKRVLSKFTRDLAHDLGIVRLGK